MTFYVPRTTNLAHQAEVFEKTQHLRSYAIFWEMGLGKSKHLIDVACALFQQGRINGVLIVAPNGVHSNWNARHEGLQAHMPEELLQVCTPLVWHSSRAKLKATQEKLRQLRNSQFPWLIMAYDAFVTESGYEVAEKFLQGRHCLMCLDEAQRIKNKKAIRSKRIRALGKCATYRRVMTGTPAEQKPFDVYQQIDWAYPGYWKEQGFGSYIAFTHHFADFRRARSPLGHEFEVQLTDRQGKPLYKNLEELSRLLKPISSRLMKAEVLDLPPKVYTRLYYEMSATQRKLYEQLEQNFVTWFESNCQPQADGIDGVIHTVSADIAIVRQLRLHQLAMGYVTDDGGTINNVVDPNPALELLAEITQDLTNPAIIWCRFRKDVDLIMALLGDQAVRYDGSTTPEERIRAVTALQGGEKQFFVSTLATGAEGLTLTAAKTSIYYSNDRKLGKRLQSEDRNHRIGQTSSVQYLDMIAQGTISEIILDGLLHGEEMSALALGDKIRQKYR